MELASGRFDCDVVGEMVSYRGQGEQHPPYSKAKEQNVKIQLAAIVSLACASACFAAKPAPQKSGGAAAAPVVWKLKFTEDFKGTKLNDKLWTRIGPGTSDWNKNMSKTFRI